MKLMHNVDVFHWLMSVKYHRNVCEVVVDCRDYVRKGKHKMLHDDALWKQSEDLNHIDREFFSNVMEYLSKENKNYFKKDNLNELCS